MTKPVKVKVLKQKPPRKIIVQVLPEGQVLELRKDLLWKKWDLGLYDVVNPALLNRGVGNLEIFEC